MRPDDLLAPASRVVELVAELPRLTSWSLTARQLCDLELLAVGAFAPLRGFMGRTDVVSVCTQVRLASGAPWPIPITLDVTVAVADRISEGGMLALRDPEGLPLAVMTVSEIWELDREFEAESVYGSLDRVHPGVDYLLRRTNDVAVAGRVEVLRLPSHPDFSELRLSPAQLRAEFSRRGWSRIVAFQTRNPMHRVHFELTRRAAERVDGGLLIHPAVGTTRPGDIDYFTRVRCYKALLDHYPPGSACLALLPIAMRMAGPREALLHAIVRRNYGCTHFIVGRDHAGPGTDAQGRPYHRPYEAQDFVARFGAEIGIEMVPFQELIFLPDEQRFAARDEIPPGARTATLSGTELRRRLEEGTEIPSWFTFPEIADELVRRCPPRTRRGFTVFLTGLSGAGKSTIAKALELRLRECGDRPITLLDGDIVRSRLSSELGFSKEHRNLNVRRVSFVASEITKLGGIAICAAIAPYDEVRREVRAEIGAVGGYLEVWISTPIEVCEQRDVKGHYAKARAGLLPSFTGVSDPYEEPTDADLAVDASKATPEEAVESILEALVGAGLLAGGRDAGKPTAR